MQLMPSQIITFPYEIKIILILISVTVVLTILIKMDRMEDFFNLFFLFCIIMALERYV